EAPVDLLFRPGCLSPGVGVPRVGPRPALAVDANIVGLLRGRIDGAHARTAYSRSWTCPGVLDSSFRRPWRSRGGAAGALAVFVVLAVLLFFSTWAHPTTTWIGDDRDPH